MGTNTGAHGPPDELESVGRFEWERILRKLDIPWPTKSVALLLATWADNDGTNLHPGEDLLARVTGLTERSIRTHLQTLRETYYLIERIERGSMAPRRGLADDYRLVVPNDLLTRAALLPERAKRRRDTPNGQQEKLPIAPVDKPATTGNPLPVDISDHRKPTSGGRQRPPETERPTTGNSATDHRKLSDRPPEAHFRPPLKTTAVDQNKDHPSSRSGAQAQGGTRPVDKPAVDKPEWAEVNERIRVRILNAAANGE